MSEIKFTPGPWLFSSYKSGTSVIVIDGKEFDVATVSYPNRDANAHLIAAAPELYEALKAVLEIETEEGAPSAPSHTSSGKSGSIAWSVKAREVYSNAHAALAKARGEA